MNLFEKSFQRYYSLRVFSWPKTNLYPDGNPGKPHSTERKGNFLQQQGRLLCHKNVTKLLTLNPHHTSWDSLPKAFHNSKRQGCSHQQNNNHSFIPIFFPSYFPLFSPSCQRSSCKAPHGRRNRFAHSSVQQISH